MVNKSLTNAKRSKNDEFYTQYQDIQKEIEAYLDFDPDTFKGKVVYCNCDDPYESNFFRYFVLNFKKLGLKRLITTSFCPSPVANTQLELLGKPTVISKRKVRPKATANKFIINKVHKIDGKDEFSLKNVAEQLKANKANEWASLQGNGDFRSDECTDLLQQADIVVTNPPFSLFREYIKQLVDHGKRFAVIGNMNAITYKEIFPLIKDNKLWLGAGFSKGNAYFSIPANSARTFAAGVYDEEKKLVKFRNVYWFTNIDHGMRHQPIPLMTKKEVIKFGKGAAFETYDNYNAIDVSKTKWIPSDYEGAMGVPISFLDKYAPEQFEIISANDIRTNESVPYKVHGLIKDKDGTINGVPTFVRLVIRKRK